MTTFFSDAQFMPGTPTQIFDGIENYSTNYCELLPSSKQAETDFIVSLIPHHPTDNIAQYQQALYPINDVVYLPEFCSESFQQFIPTQVAPLSIESSPWIPQKKTPREEAIRHHKNSQKQQKQSIHKPTPLKPQKTSKLSASSAAFYPPSLLLQNHKNTTTSHPHEPTKITSLNKELSTHEQTRHNDHSLNEKSKAKVSSHHLNPKARPFFPPFPLPHSSSSAPPISNANIITSKRSKHSTKSSNSKKETTSALASTHTSSFAMHSTIKAPSTPTTLTNRTHSHHGTDLPSPLCFASHPSSSPILLVSSGKTQQASHFHHHQQQQQQLQQTNPAFGSTLPWGSCRFESGTDSLPSLPPIPDLSDSEECFMNAHSIHSDEENTIQTDTSEEREKLSNKLDEETGRNIESESDYSTSSLDDFAQTGAPDENMWGDSANTDTANALISAAEVNKCDECADSYQSRKGFDKDILKANDGEIEDDMLIPPPPSVPPPPSPPTSPISSELSDLPKVLELIQRIPLPTS
ncbi:uncharacterized protein MONOS_11437 [Monocercomonoides exilis]|uniref:uncharacterized protein n=1 Tax=Monocercomonoides exilis TaxID=2049356 RepID=UPI00355A1864|nr:hypothetical protein MONOS_11437 [Monocercomonoides exilis]|eukprot:MONOS_11437.1-p1 / transcript=MONOS_11437.1 / gene=MONOS_11437 / organism=Monocercomonoides_exilis_PA203 / gene_product=unspecified product / transcript_product=unspecified product / location=Mono_scaffold00574:4244-5892(+) / protein_length=522 / sequence_SO=supercontig / SO=protein_coding / is_pseudo=false